MQDETAEGLTAEFVVALQFANVPEVIRYLSENLRPTVEPLVID